MIEAAKKLFKQCNDELKRIDKEYLEKYGPSGFKYIMWENNLYAVPAYFWTQRLN